ncbi:NTF2-like N-terminal transpeptidase domain-containing protein [Rhodococcus spongiicola]|uniref:Penicillin-binding protein n=1 Tax=Rhodococcus spongiicola TaxID=2487352 RepID=A0A438AT58_9NOCA|nr:NTF2-like N-terminal transpeptidase domain-containing protein [Rhodococcus spongiicola]RVW01772.1 penicillin-binding protein [Rhodococcus spongiicola]
MGFSASPRVRRGCAIALPLCLIVVSGAALASCSDQKLDASAQSAVIGFVQALNDRDPEAAAALTSYPNAAKESIQQMFDGLDAQESRWTVAQFMELNNDSGFFTVDVDWNFGEGKDWDYYVDGGVRKLSVGWRVSWDPTLLAPGLGHGASVRYDRTDAAPPKVFDDTGTPLMSEQTINAIMLDPEAMSDPAATTDRVAKAIEPVAPLVTADYMREELAAKPGEKVVAVLLRDPDYFYLEQELTRIPGVVVDKQPRLITDDRRISTPLLDPLRTVWQMNRDATAGWAVNIHEPDGSVQRQVGYQGPPGPDIQATLDSQMQLAAENAVVSVGTPAAIVAIRPSTGGIVFAAQNNQAIDQGPIAFTGLYPAGSSLDLVRQAAALESGVAPADVSDADLERAGRQLGIGLHYEMPGLDPATGVLTEAQSGVDRVMRSQDGTETQVSAFGLAMVAASVARGSVPMPMFVEGQQATAENVEDALPAAVTDQLRNTMRDNVQKGPASYLAGYRDLIGVASGNETDRWFFGSRGDLAFAVFVADADGSDRAVKMTDLLMRELAKSAQG